MTNGGDDRRTIWMRRSIVLVGMMGAGKTSVGQRLAVRLRVPFHDADAEIERLTGLKITEIFTRHGEALFRMEERRVILQLLQKSTGVLATGGGTFVNPETRAVIRNKGVPVWLRCELKTLVNRTFMGTGRPLLQAGNRAEILRLLMAQRHQYYSQADIIVDNDVGTIDVTAQSILQALGECSRETMCVNQR